MAVAVALTGAGCQSQLTRVRADNARLNQELATLRAGQKRAARDRQHEAGRVALADRASPAWAATTSRAVCTNAAPSAKSRSVATLPGTAASVRPNRRAAAAVCSAPDRPLASTTITTSASAAMSALRRTKQPGMGWVPTGNMLTSAPPPATTSSNSAAWCAG